MQVLLKRVEMMRDIVAFAIETSSKLIYPEATTANVSSDLTKFCSNFENPNQTRDASDLHVLVLSSSPLHVKTFFLIREQTFSRSRRLAKYDFHFGK